MLIETTRYELPPEGITLLGYIVRRMHKTEWLVKASALLAEGQTAQALEHAAIYATSSSTSYGRAHYQPQFNRTGEVISEADPITGAIITANAGAVHPRRQHKHFRPTWALRQPAARSKNSSDRRPCLSADPARRI